MHYSGYSLLSFLYPFLSLVRKGNKKIISAFFLFISGMNALFRAYTFIFSLSFFIPYEKWKQENSFRFFLFTSGMDALFRVYTFIFSLSFFILYEKRKQENNFRFFPVSFRFISFRLAYIFL